MKQFLLIICCSYIVNATVLDDASVSLGFSENNNPSFRLTTSHSGLGWYGELTQVSYYKNGYTTDEIYAEYDYKGFTQILGILYTFQPWEAFHIYMAAGLGFNVGSYTKSYTVSSFVPENIERGRILNYAFETMVGGELFLSKQIATSLELGLSTNEEYNSLNGETNYSISSRVSLNYHF